MSQFWDDIAARSNGQHTAQDLEAAAYRLVTEQVLYYADRHSRTAYWMLERYERDFKQALAPLGITVEVIFGPNGSGKSAMLDAVQIAMLGANSRLVALNAQADEQATTRSLRAYCLGQYGESLEHRARENATTYITLVWRDSETGEPLSMGVCLYASADREKHEVRLLVKPMRTLGRHLRPWRSRRPLTSCGSSCEMSSKSRSTVRRNCFR